MNRIFDDDIHNSANETIDSVHSNFFKFRTLYRVVFASAILNISWITIFPGKQNLK